MSTAAYRYAQAMAVTERARGRAEEERAWLDLLALLDAPAPAPSVVPEAAVEAGARAMQAENTPRPDPLNRDQREEQDDATIATYRTLTRAALTAALPFLTAAPSATREEVGEALHPGLFSLADYEYARRFDNHGAEARAQHQEAVLTDEVDPLLARFTMTPKETDTND